MRAVIFNAITSDVVLQDIGLDPAAVYAGDVDTPAQRPFVQLMWGIVPEVPNIAGVGPRVLTIWVHDQPNDYERIDAIIRRIKSILAGLVGVKHDYGWITQVDWNGDSEDGKDDGHGTIFRTTGHSVIGSGA
jgi:hypothetical protein